MRQFCLIILGFLAILAVGCGSASSGPTNAAESAGAVNKAATKNEEAEFQAEVGATIEVPVGKPPKRLVIKELKKGAGAIAKPGDEVELQYVEALYSSGKVISVAKRYAPFHRQLNFQGELLGWEKGVVGMKVGERRELIIPPDPAGDEGTFRDSATVFLVDLVGIA